MSERTRGVPADRLSPSGGAVADKVDNLCLTAWSSEFVRKQVRKCRLLTVKSRQHFCAVVECRWFRLLRTLCADSSRGAFTALNSRSSRCIGAKVIYSLKPQQTNRKVHTSMYFNKLDFKDSKLSSINQTCPHVFMFAPRCHLFVLVCASVV